MQIWIYKTFSVGLLISNVFIAAQFHNEWPDLSAIMEGKSFMQREFIFKIFQ